MVNTRKLKLKKKEKKLQNTVYISDGRESLDVGFLYIGYWNAKKILVRKKHSGDD